MSDHSSEVLRLTAFHEAGHAVMAHLCGQIVMRVEILGEPEHTGTCTARRLITEREAHGDPAVPTAAIEARILCLCAGIAAENMIRDEARAPTDDDVNEAVGLALRVVGDCLLVMPFLEEAMEHAESILRRHWRAVEALAEELLERRDLSGPEVRAVIDPQLG
jgi:ATP-dependent Zn protease